MDCGSSNRAVALAAKHIDRRHVQQPRILRAMRRMAGEATLALHRGMFVDKWSALFRVALGADGVLVSGGAQIAVAETAVHIVAVVAIHCAFIHLVVEGHGELRLHVVVALEAELWR